MKTHSITSLALIVWFGLLCHVPDAAAARKAFVVGNEKYTRLTRLDDAPRDAGAMAGVLASLGFDVTLKTDLGKENFEPSFNRFLDGLSFGDECIFYYSGHGVGIDGEAYFVPIDVVDNYKSTLKGESLTLTKVVDGFARKKASTRLIFLDCCRSDDSKADPGTSGNTPVGLPEPHNLDDTLVFFATKHGQVARQSPKGSDFSFYTEALVQHLRALRPGVAVDHMHIAVTKDVLARTNGNQRPYPYGSVTEPVYLKGRMEQDEVDSDPVQAPEISVLIPPVPLPEAQVTEAQILDFLRTWESAWESRDIDTYMPHYAVEFKGLNYSTRKGYVKMTRSEWEEDKRKKFAALASISVTCGDVEYSIIGDLVKVSFPQTYRGVFRKSGDVYADSGTKEMVLLNEEDGFTILHEAFTDAVSGEAGNTEAERFIESWRSAWQSQDLDSYAAHYDDSFVGTRDSKSSGRITMDYDGWMEYMGKRFGEGVRITVNISNLEVEETGDGGLRATFRQSFSKPGYSDSGSKTLELIGDGAGGYKIVSETFDLD